MKIMIKLNSYLSKVFMQVCSISRMQPV